MSMIPQVVVSQLLAWFHFQNVRYQDGHEHGPEPPGKSWLLAACCWDLCDTSSPAPAAGPPCPQGHCSPETEQCNNANISFTTGANVHRTYTQKPPPRSAGHPAWQNTLLTAQWNCKSQCYSEYAFTFFALDLVVSKPTYIHHLVAKRQPYTKFRIDKQSLKLWVFTVTLTTAIQSFNRTFVDVPLN